jgi:hypothetical protein
MLKESPFDPVIKGPGNVPVVEVLPASTEERLKPSGEISSFTMNKSALGPIWPRQAVDNETRRKVNESILLSSLYTQRLNCFWNESDPCCRFRGGIFQYEENLAA